MASTPEYVSYLCEQLRGTGTISARPTFGEYGLYWDGKLIGLICDNQLFIKKTAAGAALLPDPVEVPPYPGAKLYFLIDCTDSPEILLPFLRATWEELPFPKPKKKKSPGN